MRYHATKQLQDAFPWLLLSACAAHRVAVACGDASAEVPYMATFGDHLQQLHLHFHSSANRTAVLKAAAESFGLKELKVKRGCLWYVWALNQHKQSEGGKGTYKLMVLQTCLK